MMNESGGRGGGRKPRGRGGRGGGGGGGGMSMGGGNNAVSAVPLTNPSAAAAAGEKAGPTMGPAVGDGKAGDAAAAIEYRFGEQKGAQNVQDWNARTGLPGLKLAAVPPPKQLLSDAQVQHFIQFGYVVVQPTGLDSAFHTAMYAHCQQFFAGASGRGDAHNPGNNVLPVMPALSQVFDDPAVSGALQSLVGDGYAMHAHRYAHPSFPGRREQPWHKDSYFGFQETRAHRPHWVMAMYYPQDTTLPMGPTGLLPATHYFANTAGDRSRHAAHPPADWPVTEWPAVCGAGSVVVMAYDLWHKGMANDSALNRYMFKFQFVRTTQPTQPTWACANAAWDPFAELAVAATAATTAATAATGTAMTTVTPTAAGDAKAGAPVTATGAVASTAPAALAVPVEMAAALLRSFDTVLVSHAGKTCARAAVEWVSALANVDAVCAARVTDRAAKQLAKATAAAATASASAKGASDDAKANKASHGPTAFGTVFSDPNEVAFLAGRLTQLALDAGKAACGGDAAFAALDKDELKAVKAVSAQAAQRALRESVVPRDKRRALVRACGDAWVDVWRWMCGLQPRGADVHNADTSALSLADLKSESEPLRVFTAYRTARDYGVAAVPALLKSVSVTTPDAEGRNAMYALTAVGRPALRAVVDALNGTNEALVQSRLCFVAGEIAGAAGGLLAGGGADAKLALDTVDALCRVLIGPHAAHAHSRKDAAQALCKLFVRIPSPTPIVATATAATATAAPTAAAVDAKAPAATPPLATAVAALTHAVHALIAGAADAAEQVRYISCLALGRIALATSPGGSKLTGQPPVPFPAELVPPVLQALAGALNDECRYVVGNALEALKLMRHISPDDSVELVFRALTVLRWCPITTMQKAF